MKRRIEMNYRNIKGKRITIKLRNDSRDMDRLAEVWVSGLRQE
jgi:hypothetical protein